MKTRTETVDQVFTVLMQNQGKLNLACHDMPFHSPRTVMFTFDYEFEQLL